MVRPRTLGVVAASIGLAVAVPVLWLFFLDFVEEGVLSLPVVGGIDFNVIVLNTRPPSFNEVLYTDKCVISSPFNSICLMPGIPGLYLFISLGLIGFLIPLYIEANHRYRDLMALRRQVFEVLQLVSSYMRTGTPLSQTLAIISRSLDPPLGPRLRVYARLIAVNADPDEAFATAFSDLPRDSRILLRTLSIAAYGGGRAQEIVRTAASFASNIRRFDEVRSSRLAGASTIVFISVLAFAVSAVVMLALIQILASSSAEIISLDIPLEYIYVIYYVSSLIIAFFGSMMIARVVKNVTLMTAKYMLWLTIIILFSFLLVQPILSVMVSG